LPADDEVVDASAPGGALGADGVTVAVLACEVWACQSECPYELLAAIAGLQATFPVGRHWVFRLDGCRCAGPLGSRTGATDIRRAFGGRYPHLAFC
jgi:hypothetical protein